MEKEQEHKNIILGGFLSFSHYYSSMKNRIEEISGEETFIVSVPHLLWYALFFPRGWIFILKKLELTLAETLKSNPQSKVTLIGHSIGGVLSLLYLVCPLFQGSERRLSQSIVRVITLGSPHKNKCRWLHGGGISRMVGKYGGASRIRNGIHLTCIAGKGICGNKEGKSSEKRAYAIYKAVGGKGDVWGDGIIPVASALLSESNPIVLENIVHFSNLGQAWYGTPAIVSQWWPMTEAA